MKPVNFLEFSKSYKERRVRSTFSHHNLAEVVLGEMREDYSLKDGINFPRLTQKIFQKNIGAGLESARRFVRMLQLTREFLLADDEKKEDLRRSAEAAEKKYDKYLFLGIRCMLQDKITSWSQIEEMMAKAPEITLDQMRATRDVLQTDINDKIFGKEGGGIDFLSEPDISLGEDDFEESLLLGKLARERLGELMKEKTALENGGSSVLEKMDFDSIADKFGSFLVSFSDEGARILKELKKKYGEARTELRECLDCLEEWRRTIDGIELLKKILEQEKTSRLSVAEKNAGLAKENARLVAENSRLQSDLEKKRKRKRRKK